MAIKSICVSCGKPKSSPFLDCRACGYKPRTEYEISRALIFSSKRRIGGVTLGRDAQTLKTLSKQIMGGRPYEFDPDETQRAVNAYRQYLKDRTRQKRQNKIIIVVILMALALAAAVIVLRDTPFLR